MGYDIQALSSENKVQIFSTGGTINQLVSSFSSQSAQVLDLPSLVFDLSCILLLWFLMGGMFAYLLCM